MSQRQLFKTDAALRPLTDRQARLYSIFLAAGPDGLDAAELGARLHAGRLMHGPDERCIDCGRDGQRILKERGIRQRLIRKPGPVYVARELLTERAPEPSPPLPGTTWEDMFPQLQQDEEAA